MTCRVELGEDLRPYYDLDGIIAGLDQKYPSRTYVPRTCKLCGSRDLVPLARVRHAAKRGSLQAVCVNCRGQLRRGSAHPNWKGGKYTNGDGYVKVKVPGHPAGDKDGYVLEHRYVMEQQLGRYLYPWETVHHRNGDRADNQPENLELWTGQHGNGVRATDLTCCPNCGHQLGMSE